MNKFQPDGWHTVTPRIVTPDPECLIGFLKEVFGASGEYCADRPAEMRIGDSRVMVSGKGQRDSIAAFL
jgi:PhnB protein